MKFDILTLFPSFFDSPLKESLIGKAVDKGLIEVGRVNMRDYTPGGVGSGSKDSKVDDSPYGGGAGMVLMAEPVVKAIEDARGARGTGGESSEVDGQKSAKVVLLTPQGRPFNQSLARELAEEDHLILVCGKYEGFDERIREFADLEVSLGDFVMTGGEVAALALIDTVARLKTGVVGKGESLERESFGSDEGLGALLEYPQYTRPEEFRGMKVPPVLLGGNHKEIDEWRRRESIKRTLKRRPDLIDKAVAEGSLTKKDLETIKELKKQ